MYPFETFRTRNQKKYSCTKLHLLIHPYTIKYRHSRTNITTNNAAAALQKAWASHRYSTTNYRNPFVQVLSLALQFRPRVLENNTTGRQQSILRKPAWILTRRQTRPNAHVKERMECKLSPPPLVRSHRRKSPKRNPYTHITRANKTFSPPPPVYTAQQVDARAACKVRQSAISFFARAPLYIDKSADKAAFYSEDRKRRNRRGHCRYICA